MIALHPGGDLIHTAVALIPLTLAHTCVVEEILNVNEVVIGRTAVVLEAITVTAMSVVMVLSNQGVDTEHGLYTSIITVLTHCVCTLIRSLNFVIM